MSKTSFSNRILVFLFLMLFVAGGVAYGVPMPVKVKNVVGKVETQSGAPWAAVKEGDTLSAGDNIRTGPGSSCMLVWAGGNTFKVGPLTNIKIATAEKNSAGKETSSIELKSGKFTAHAKPLPSKDSSFSVKTPTAVAGVRGTDVFGDSDESGASNIGVAAGSVEISSGGGEPIVVEEGMMVDVDTTGAVSEPEMIPPEVMNEVKEDLKEVNDEAKQAESEASGESAAPKEKESKESKEEAKAESKETKEETKEESKEESKEETSSSSDSGAGDTDVTDSATSSVDTALDTQLSGDVADTAQDAGEKAYDTGEVEVIINFNSAQ